MKSSTESLQEDDVIDQQSKDQIGPVDMLDF